jgi:hypothetical protein
MMVTTLARMVRLHVDGVIDQTWQNYWTFVAAMVALTVTSATALRSLFVGGSGGGGGGEKRNAAGGDRPSPPFVRDVPYVRQKPKAHGWGSQVLASLFTSSAGGSAAASAAAAAAEAGTGDGGESGRVEHGTDDDSDMNSTDRHTAPRRQARRWFASRWFRDESVPRGTITGIRTYIWGEHNSQSTGAGARAGAGNEWSVTTDVTTEVVQKWPLGTEPDVEATLPRGAVST